MVPDTKSLQGVQGLVTFESPDLGAALAGATATARALVSPENVGSDVYLAVPTGSRWTIDEIGEQLLYQQAYQPQGDVRVVIVANAHLMDARTHDHLLKMVEEPPAPILFIFTVANSQELPVTLQSRIFRRVEVPPRSIEDLRQALRPFAKTEPSRELLMLVQKSPLLSAAIAGDGAAGAVEAGEVFTSSLRGTGFSGAFQAHGSLKTLAKTASGVGAESPKTKAVAREVLRAGLQLMLTEAMDVLAAGSEDGQRDVARADRLRRSLNLANMNLPEDQVLAYAFRGATSER